MEAMEKKAHFMQVQFSFSILLQNFQSMVINFDDGYCVSRVPEMRNVNFFTQINSFQMNLPQGKSLKLQRVFDLKVKTT